MRILRVIPTVNTEYGGPIEGLTRSTQALAAVGHETVVASLDDPASPWVKDFPFPVQACGPGLKGYGFNMQLPRWIRQNADQFDVAVLHGLWNFASVGGWMGLRGTDLPYVQFVHGMLDPWFNSVQPVKRWAKQAYWTALQGRVLNGAEMVLFTTEEERLLARSSFWGHPYREHVVAYGASEAPPHTPEQDAAFRATVPELGARPYLLYMSRIHPKKGCDLLIEAYARLAGQMHGLQLVMAGPDPVGLVAELKASAARLGIRGSVHWAGMLKGEAKWGALHGSEAFILPSHQENFGIAVAEALSCGRPVLISDKVNIWREVKRADAGLVESDTLDGTASLLTRFAELAPSKAEAMKRNARQCYEANFSATGAATSLIEVLERVRRPSRAALSA